MYRFHDSRVNTKIFIQLQDLTTVLSGNPQLNFSYSYGAAIDLIANKITASRFWEKLDAETMEAGLKSDCFLRTVGTMRYSDLPAMQKYKKIFKETKLPKFASQLFALLEDIRLEEIVKKERPGTKHLFDRRKQYLKQYFTQQLAANVTRSFPLDELFCLIYLLIQSEHPDPAFPRATEKQLNQLGKLKPLLYSIFETKDTKQIVNLCEQIVFSINQQKDTVNEYFIFPIGHLESYTKNTLFDELTRTDELVNDDEEDVNKEKSEYFDETFSTWHRENKNENRKQNFLQFELEQGTKTSMLGGGARETEDADQAMASIQGSSAESKEKDYSKVEALNKQTVRDRKQGSESVYGEENAEAVQLLKEARIPTPEEERLYQEFIKEIELYQRKLANTIKRQLSTRKIAHIGTCSLAVYRKNCCRLYLKIISEFSIKRTRNQMKWTLYLLCLSIAPHQWLIKWRKRKRVLYYFTKY